ncbi:adenosylhomocysteinase [Vibrio nitrifigilis]|uniref:Adenosylhomocysteinase n=1 Tax=Vibrio nitrifigilis TaxID=2789781 RepID=A0ABS0GD76_9VIBR|nr:adenosylhomocysteinase [Vibrio nitrifigilis]MBF9000371.1 adenosylhomocysteinase [Vibrio nitrifigilis]
MYKDFTAELNWTTLHMKRTAAAVAALPDLYGIRLACNMHLDLKMIPLVEGLINKGAQIYLTTCNPTTVQDDVVQYLVSKGAQAYAWRDMSDDEWSRSFDLALEWLPTHLCEMGADLTTRLHERFLGSEVEASVKASLEATGSGISRLGDVEPSYPIFNWDDLPVKEGLHNRHMVGLTAWHTFFQTTHLTLHEKVVIVIGYGLVGQGTAEAAKAYGGQVKIVETNPARALQAQYDGWQVISMAQATDEGDVFATATGANNVLSAEHLANMKDGVFVLNVGHVAKEIDVAFLQENATHQQPMPFINAYQLYDKTIYLLANGSMFNLTAGFGDSLNAFDVTLAVMAGGIGHIVGQGSQHAAGLYLLPESAWMSVL